VDGVENVRGVVYPS